MQFLESWLRAWVDPPIDTEELAHRLTMAGLEVEETCPAMPPLNKVVVAAIVAVSPHPNADKLRVCQVDDGSEARLQIVCGAPNATAGLKVPLAKVGAQLPGGITIAGVNMRGVESQGMLCSARELGLWQEDAGLFELPSDAVPGMPLSLALNLDTTRFTLKLTPNRADCLSILGVAREVAALTGAPLRMPTFSPVPVTCTEILPVTLQAPKLCGRFAGRVIRAVNAQAPTPLWMKTRLENAGYRSISALVDISNYVMLEWGQPNHLFDLDQLSGALSVRWARPGESLTLLNDQTLTLEEDVGVVCAGETAVALAGIMGGAASAITLHTHNIYVETAFWWPSAIAGRARRYKLTSQASHRFERGVDYANIPHHLDLLSRLIIDICGGECGPIDDQIAQLPCRQTVSMRLARCHRVLGIQIPRDEVAQIFTRLGLPYRLEGDTFQVDPPSYRFDLHIEEDLIEEVARIYGFERIPDTVPAAPLQIQVQSEACDSPHLIRRKMAARDYQEVMNFSFVDAQWEEDYSANSNPIKVLNPIAHQLAVMRSSLLGGLVANICYNANRQQPRVRVFEMARVFTRDSAIMDGDLTVGGVRQPLNLAAAAWGPSVPEQWGVPARQVDFYDVKMDIQALFGERAGALRFVSAVHPALHPGQSARIEFTGESIGWIGALHPRLMQKVGLTQAPILFELAFSSLEKARVVQGKALSRQPIMVRDLAFWVDVALPAQDLLDTIFATMAQDPYCAIVQDVSLFDIWREKTQADRPTSEKSLAFRFWLQDTAATLEEARVADCLARLTDRLAHVHGARLRS